MNKSWESAAWAAVAFLSFTAASAAASPLPPADYGGRDFVDVDGCLYSRADVGGWQIWVQRLDDDKQPVCGLTPTETGSDRPSLSRTGPSNT